MHPRMAEMPAWLLCSAYACAEQNGLLTLNSSMTAFSPPHLANRVASGG